MNNRTISQDDLLLLERKVRLTETRKTLLKTIAVSGVIAMAFVAPNFPLILKKMGLLDFFKKNPKYNFWRSIAKLEKDGLIERHKGSEGVSISLTSLGRKYVTLFAAEEREKRWDKKWRVLIFDIQEKRKSIRDKIRHTLLEIGFVKVQDSVWVYPYNCEEIVTLIKAELKVGKELLYLIVDALEGDEYLKKHFKLKG